MIGFDDDGIFRAGIWSFLLHDHGWFVANRQVIQLEARWPTWKTFHRGGRV